MFELPTRLSQCLCPVFLPLLHNKTVPLPRVSARIAGRTQIFEDKPNKLCNDILLLDLNACRRSMRPEQQALQVGASSQRHVLQMQSVWIPPYSCSCKLG